MHYTSLTHLLEKKRKFNSFSHISTSHTTQHCMLQNAPFCVNSSFSSVKNHPWLISSVNTKTRVKCVVKVCITLHLPTSSKKKRNSIHFHFTHHSKHTRTWWCKTPLSASTHPFLPSKTTLGWNLLSQSQVGIHPLQPIHHGCERHHFLFSSEHGLKTRRVHTKPFHAWPVVLSTTFVD